MIIPTGGKSPQSGCFLAIIIIHPGELVQFRYRQCKSGWEREQENVALRPPSLRLKTSPKYIFWSCFVCRRILFSISTLMMVIVSLVSCNNRAKEGKSIAVFIPGVLEGSPTYEMLDEGVRNATEKTKITVKTIEGGFDQATWLDQITALSSEGLYTLIVTSNPAMSEICASVAKHFPEQEFLVFDGSGLGGSNVTEVLYAHLEQAWLIGYFAGLITTSKELQWANEALKVGMIVGQEYPQMNKQIIPGFEIGLHVANPNIKREFRVLGNWYDADKAHSMAEALIAEDVDVILTIAGGANEGVLAASKESEAYVLWFDIDGTSLAPGIVLGSAIIKQNLVAEEWIQSWIEGSLERGSSSTVGVKEGYIDFPLDTKNMIRYVPEDILQKMQFSLDQIRNSSINLHPLEY